MANTVDEYCHHDVWAIVLHLEMQDKRGGLIFPCMIPIKEVGFFFLLLLVMNY